VLSTFLRQHGIGARFGGEHAPPHASGIRSIKIADRVEVSIDLKARQLSGPWLVYKQ
jgi:hypothetical protein